MKNVIKSVVAAGVFAATIATIATPVVAKVETVKGTKKNPTVIRVVGPKKIDPGYKYGCYEGHRYVRDGVNGWMSVGGKCGKGDAAL